jgi:hypothetical protein
VKTHQISFCSWPFPAWKTRKKDMIVSFNDWVSQGLHTCPRQLINAWYLSFCWWECCHPKILIGKQIHESSSVWLAQLLTVLICQIGKLWVWMQIMTETFFEFNNLLNWLEQWCWWSTCCTWGVLKATGDQVASGCRYSNSSKTVRKARLTLELTNISCIVAFCWQKCPSVLKLETVVYSNPSENLNDSLIWCD